jgi:anti-sigma regulatory factor (Ser/Thr protein kinase)
LVEVLNASRCLNIDTFDETVARLFSSLDLNATLDAVVDALVPAWASSLVLVIQDERNVAFARSAGERSPDLREIAFPLLTDGKPFGSLRVGVSAANPEGANPEEMKAGVERIVAHATRALVNARRFDRERNVALSFQNAALTAELPPFGAFVFDAMYEAGRAEALVGGDWYDAFQLRDGRIVVSIGDVVGSGLNAAIAMVNVRQAIRGVAQVHPDPALMLEAADLTLRAQHPDRYVTAFVGVIDPVTQQCAYANAGHPPPFLRSADATVTQVAGHGIPIGLGIADAIEVHHVTLPPGSCLVLYTDGLTESGKNVVEGEQRLEQTLHDPGLFTGPGAARRIHDAVLGAYARDDVAILVVSVGAAEPLRRWRFDPVWPDLARRARRELRAELAENGLGAKRLLDVELIFAELMGNLVRYAPGIVEIILERHGGNVVLHVLDKGPGFAFTPRLPPDLFSQSGRGLFLIAHLALNFSVERRAGGGSHARIVLDVISPSRQGASP